MKRDLKEDVKYSISFEGKVDRLLKEHPSLTKKQAEGFVSIGESTRREVPC